jgi:hypothetical protein
VWVAAGQTSTGANTEITDASTLHHGRVRGTMRHDYTRVYDAKSGDIYPTIDMYSNDGHGGLYQKGDGCRYCDMRGTGADDYIWMKSDGSMYLFGNTHNPPYWDDLGLLPNPVTPSINLRKKVHLADIDGDGKCDYIIVDPILNFFTAYINVWTADGGFKWGPARTYSAYGSSGLTGPIGLM